MVPSILNFIGLCLLLNANKEKFEGLNWIDLNRVIGKGV